MRVEISAVAVLVALLIVESSWLQSTMEGDQGSADAEEPNVIMTGKMRRASVPTAVEKSAEGSAVEIATGRAPGARLTAATSSATPPLLPKKPTGPRKSPSMSALDTMGGTRSRAGSETKESMRKIRSDDDMAGKPRRGFPKTPCSLGEVGGVRSPSVPSSVSRPASSSGGQS